jgi:hypothetical protein
MAPRGAFLTSECVEELWLLTRRFDFLRGCLRIPCARAVCHFEGGATPHHCARTKTCAPTEKSTVCCWWPVARPALALSACVATSSVAGAAASALQQSDGRFLGPATSGVKTGYGVAGPRNDSRGGSCPGAQRRILKHPLRERTHRTVSCTTACARPKDLLSAVGAGFRVSIQPLRGAGEILRSAPTCLRNRWFGAAPPSGNQAVE